MRIAAIAILVLLTFTGYAQKRQKIDELVVKDTLVFQGGNPDTNKIAVSMDGLGNFKWVYFTDFQDSINTGVYDSLIINYLYSNAVRVNRDSFTDPAATIASIGDSGFIVECFTCDTIQLLLDSTYNSPFTYNGTGNIVQRDTTLDVGIGTTTPTARLHVEGDILLQNNDTAKFILLEAVNNVSGDYGFMQVVSNDITLEVGTGLYSPAFGVNGNTGITFDAGGGVIRMTSIGEAEGYVLTSDASGNATWQDPTAYGEMGFGDSTRTIALTQNVFSVVTNSNNTLWSTAAVDLHNVTYSGDSLIIDSAGTYQVNVQLSVDGATSSVIRLGVFLNGVLACTCTGYQELVNNQIIQLSYINIDALNAGDVVQVVITNTANSDDVDAIAGKLTVNRIK